MRFKAASRPGRVAGALALAFLAWAFVVQPIIRAIARGWFPLSIGPLNVVPAIAFGLALAALATATWAIVRRHDRSVATWLALVPGLAAIILETVERLFP